jgi:hypothetical protein
MSVYIGKGRPVWVFVGASRQGEEGRAGSLPDTSFFSILFAASQHVNFTFDEHIFSLAWILKGGWGGSCILAPFPVGARRFVMTCFVFSGAPGIYLFLGGRLFWRHSLRLHLRAGHAGGVDILSLRFYGEFYCMHPR